MKRTHGRCIDVNGWFTSLAFLLTSFAAVEHGTATPAFEQFLAELFTSRARASVFMKFAYTLLDTFL